MAHVRDLLWLKARLITRGGRGTGGAWLSLIGIFLALASTVVGTGIMVLGLLSMGPEKAQLVGGVALGSLYLGWILGPALGYRLNEGLDPTALTHLPIPTTTLVLAIYLGNFLDPVVLVSLPLVTGLGYVGHCFGGSWILGSLAVFFFLFHAMGLAQMLYLVVLHLFRKRGMAEMVFLVGGLFLIGAVLLFEVETMDSETLAQGARGRMALLEAAWPYTPYLSATPPGLVIEAMMPARVGVHRPEAAVSVLALIAFLTVALASRVTRVLLQTGSGSRSESARSKEAKGDWLFDFLRAWIPSQAIAGRAAAEIRLLLREPQYILLVASYPMVFGLLFFWTRKLPDGVREAMFGFFELTSIFFFLGIMTNGLAVERRGIQLAFRSPTSPLGYLVAKNLGTFLLLSTISMVVLGFSGPALGVPLKLMPLYALAGELCMLVVLGMGNLASVLAPLPLPSKGFKMSKGMTPTRIFLAIFGNSFTMSVAMAFSWTIVLVSIVLPYQLQELSPGWAVAFGVLLAGGLYTGSTLVAAALLDRRRDILLEALDG